MDAEECHECGNECWHMDNGYFWCRPCGEHHRGSECAIDKDGRSLEPVSGIAWDDLP